MRNSFVSTCPENTYADASAHSTWRPWACVRYVHMDWRMEKAGAMCRGLLNESTTGIMYHHCHIKTVPANISSTASTRPSAWRGPTCDELSVQ
eukprot:scaffold84201_cov32-Tisochrysis_lutea.AAC.6